MRMATICAIAIGCMVSVNVLAADYKVGSLEVVGPWSRATPKGAPTAIGYMTIKNNGTSSDRLVGGSADFADKFELHSMTMENNVSKMRGMKSVEIKPGESVVFKPGGSHVMFVGMKHPLTKGEHVKGLLIFERAGTVQIEYDVEGIGAQGPHMHH